MLIGFAGYAGSGKDTAADIIMNKISSKKFHTYALAGPVKEAASIMFGIDLKLFYDPVLKNEVIEEWGFSPRYMAQKLGTEGGRNLFRKDIWVKRAEMEHKNKVEDGDFNGMLITDVRFPNEVEKIKEMGGHVIRINRDDTQPVNPHESEQYIDSLDADVDIYNNGSMEYFETNVEEVYKQILNHETNSALSGIANHLMENMKSL